MQHCPHYDMRPYIKFCHISGIILNLLFKKPGTVTVVCINTLKVPETKIADFENRVEFGIRRLIINHLI